MLNANNDLTKYLTMNPQAFSYTLLGLSTLILAYFVGEDNSKPVEEPVAKSSDLEEEEPDSLDTDESSIDELINKQTSEQIGGKKNKKHKTNRRK